MFTGRFARDMESARVIITRRLFIVQESQWREFKMDSNEIVSSKFKYYSNVKDASQLFGVGVTIYLFKNRSSGARVLLPTSKASSALTFHGKLNEELKLELVSNFQSNCFIEICSKWLPTSSSPTFGKDLDLDGICSSLQEMSSHQIEGGQEFETYSQHEET